MVVKSPLLRPLGIAAGGLGLFQALIWGILSLLGILAYTEVIPVPRTTVPSKFFAEILVIVYFHPDGGVSPDIMKPGTVVIWTSVYLATSVIWLLISGLLLHDFCASKFTSTILIGWVTVTAAVSAIDLAGAVTFGVDYSNMQSLVDTYLPVVNLSTNFLLAPILLMTMCARGFVLWVINVSLVIYLAVAARNVDKKIPASRPSTATEQSPHPVDMYSRGRQNPGFQPDPISAWDIQSPAVGNQQRNPWDFPEDNSPHFASDTLRSNKMLPRVGRPVSTPVVPADPLPIPQPDYSPPPGRPTRHEPNPYDSPQRSALKKTNQYGRTIF